MIPIITLDGRTNVELNFIVLRGSTYPVIPPTIDRKVFIPGRNGTRNLGSDLDARKFDFRCAINAANARDLQQRVSELATFFLDSYGKPRDIELILIAQGERYYTVTMSGDTTLDRSIGHGEFTLSLVADDPYAYLVDDPILDSDIILDSDFRLNGEEYILYSVDGPESTIIPNSGSLIASPTIEVTGSFTTLSITANGKTFGYSQAISNKTLVINGDLFVVKLDGANKLSAMTGDFIHFMPGDNTVAISGTGLDIDVQFRLYPKFI